MFFTRWMDGRKEIFRNKKTFTLVLIFAILCGCSTTGCGGFSGILNLPTQATWAKSTASGNGDSKFYGLAVGPDGSIYAVGYITGTGAYNFGNNVSVTGAVSGSNLVLVKYDSFGTAQWAKTCAGSSTSTYYGVTVGADGSIYAAGFINGNSTYNFGNSVTATGPNTFSSVVLVKYDSAGNAQWAKTVTSGSSLSFYYGVVAGADGSIYSVGYINGSSNYDFGNSTLARGNDSSTNLVLVKYDSSGNAVWAKSTTSGTNASSYIGVALGTDGSIFAAGYISGSSTFGFGNSVSTSGSVSGGNTSLVLVKYDSSGNAVWAKSTTSGTSPSGYNGVALGADGSIYAVGYMQGSASFGFGNSIAAYGSAVSDLNLILVKYDSSGNAQWVKTTVSGASASSYSGVSVGLDGNVYAAGFMTGTSIYGFGNGVTATGVSTNANLVLVKYDSSGNTQWAKTSTNAATYSYYTSVSSVYGRIYSAGYVYGNSTYDFGNSVTAAGFASSSTNPVLIKY